MSILTHDVVDVNFDLIPTEAEEALADRLAWEADGGEPDDYRPGWADNFEPAVEDEAWLLGFTLGAEGELADLPTPDDAERAAFFAGLDAGDDFLWHVDPLWAAHVSDLAAESHRMELVEAGLLA